ncbi:MAG: cob(I)yrinic acid a,c-diamide adenosyltransferase [Syntrophomonadaceae bacterium]|nr:cob(I)yrinic acid a,c-diamide adenosyltransferase [Syntrophomonadaceae bacterium]
MNKSSSGMLQIYTGNGKGKTTAAIGLGIRCAGAGGRIYLFSFMKNKSSEHAVLERLKPGFNFYIANRNPRGFWQKMSVQERKDAVDDARLAWAKVQALIAARECDMLILDEAMSLLKYDLVSVQEMLEVVGICKKSGIELVLTGRNVPTEITAVADLVTEMQEIKHFLANGVKARRGIEY